GLQSYAPFLPSALFGTATIVALWWLARSWFGKSAGIFIAVIAAMSDFHILYSRMALTDVACLFWIILSVALGTRAMNTRRFKTAAAAGLACGLAWWTKYTGWLPIAILCTGGGLWWIVNGRKSLSFRCFAGILGTIIAVAALTFSPWWWQLQDVGGYTVVAETHKSFLTGASLWRANMAQQLRDQLLLDGTAGHLSLGIGLFLAGLLRWSAGRSTWNAASASGTVPTIASGSLPPLRLLLRFTAAAIALMVISIRISTPLMLICISVAGLSGIYLWPVLQRSWHRRQTNDLSPTSPGAISLSASDLDAAPTIDPSLGLFVTLAWFVGMLLSTPMYLPYSRLFFPLLAAVWLATAGGVGWWLESNLSVARRIAGTGQAAPASSWGQKLVTAMLAAALVSSFIQFDENNELEFANLFRSSLFQDRSSIAHAATGVADACVDDATRASPYVARIAPNIDINSITPQALLAAQIRASDSASEHALSAALDSMSPEKRRKIRMVVYAYGEPSLLFHLNQTGIIVAPVNHLNLRGPGHTSPAVPTFLVFGPNAKRTPGFWEELMQHSEHLRRVTTIEYKPSEVTLLDMFDPTWLREHPEAWSQTLEVHRVE
ncbi:MAG: glycosyltransferase family 39 protein, partial [Planctomycetota bacterium]|nr:glycosyltransferase family 39 protein [Planctomycetota bacterium]